MRASDADRDRTLEVLATASSEGRLTLAEYSQRSDAALGARTLGDLAGLTDDLPSASMVTARGALDPAGAAADSEEISALLGNESRKGHWVVPPHMTVRSVLGDCHLEMQEATIGQHVTTIEATIRFGSVTIWVPDGIDVRLSGRSILGAKSSELRGQPKPGAPVIIVRCDVLCGSLTVKRPGWKMRLKTAISQT